MIKKGIEKTTGRVVAIKEILLEVEGMETYDICKDITFMISNNSPNLVKYYDYYIHEDMLYIILEYLPERSLIDLVRSL